MSNQWNQNQNQYPPAQQPGQAAANPYAPGGHYQPQAQPTPYQGHQHAQQQPQVHPAAGLSLGQQLAGVDPLTRYLPAPPQGRHLFAITAMQRRQKVEHNGGRSEIVGITVETVESDSVAPGTRFEIAYFPGSASDQYNTERRKLRSLMDALGIDLQTQHAEIDRAFGEEQIYTGRQFVVTGNLKMGDDGKPRMRKNGQPIVNYWYEPVSAWKQLNLPLAQPPAGTPPMPGGR